jgi:YHS domain-containing protein
MRSVICGLLFCAAVGGISLVSGCSSNATKQPVMASSTANTASHAECAVCKANADLACVDVTVDDQTPRCDYNGKTYYFCSNSCRDEFAKDPAKYVSAK